MGKDPAKQINNIVFFDRAGLKDFLYGENVMKEGFLQRFVAPATIPFDNTATNVTLHVSWSQYKCLIEQVSDCLDVACSAFFSITSCDVTLYHQPTEPSDRTINFNGSCMHRHVMRLSPLTQARLDSV